MKRVFLLLLFALSSCSSSDGVDDEDFDAAMTREAACIVSSERFGLYKKAIEHYKHGENYGASRFRQSMRNGEPIESDFWSRINTVRSLYVELSNNWHAKNLKVHCNTEIEVWRHESF